jgi:ComF family protein
MVNPVVYARNRGCRVGLRRQMLQWHSRWSIQSEHPGCQPSMRNSVDRQIERLCGFVLPPRCVLCGRRGQRPCLDLCHGCEASLPPAREPEPGGTGVLRRVYAPFSYAAPLDQLVHSLKYRGHLATGRVLGTLLAERLEALGLHRDVDVIVPVPLHPARLAARGFNQTSEIARHVGRRLQRPLDERIATRCRATPPQVGLHLDERLRNLAGAFVAAGVAGRRVAIVDDVTTTGSTLAALAAALQVAGATSVDAWCVALAGRRDIAATAAPPCSEPR